MIPLPRLRDSGNLLLDRLPADEFGPPGPHLRRADLAHKQVVHEDDAGVESVHFPTTALVSLLTVLEEEDPAEAPTVGREGMIGVGAVLGVDPSPHRALCRMAGATLRLPIGESREAIRRGPALARLARRYAAFALRSAGQGIARNALHPREARAWRWLLTVQDQAGGDEFPHARSSSPSCSGCAARGRP